MRSLPILLQRIRCGLLLTKDEMAVVKAWIKKRKKEQARFEKIMFVIALIIVIAGVIAGILK